MSSAEMSRCRYVRCGAWLEDLDDFDQGIFGLAPGDAVTLDPQARILLEQVQVRRRPYLCSCLVHVGVMQNSTGTVMVQEVAGAPGGEALQQHRSSAGVYVGCMYSEFLDSVLEPVVRQPISAMLQ